MTEQEALAEAFGKIALFACALAQHAGDIAHARRTLYLAYLAEGFTESQALELCKALSVA